MNLRTPTLQVGLLIGCTVAPEFCGPALIASLATSYLSYLDKKDPVKFIRKVEPEKKLTLDDLIRLGWLKENDPVEEKPDPIIMTFFFM